MAGSEHPTASVSEFGLKLVRDPKLPADTRMAIAPKCYPAKQTQSARPRRSRGSSDSQNSGNVGLEVLDSFLGVVQDVAAAPKERRKAALKIAQFLLPKVAKRARVLPDEFGFRIDPTLAKLFRDAVREALFMERQPNRIIPANAEKLKRLKACADAILERIALPCPSIYDEKQREKDRARFSEFADLRREKASLTEEEEAEEAHLRVRIHLTRARREPHISGPR